MTLLCSPLVAHLLFAHANLNQLQADIEANSKLAPEARKAPSSYNPRLWAIIDSNELRTADEYALAADVVQFDYANYYEVSRVQYELTYTAVALGSKEAKAHLAERWDQLTMALGRNRTLGGVALKDVRNQEGNWLLHQAPKRIIDILLHPATTKPAAQDNAEIEKMFTEDQAVRSGKLTQIDMAKMMRDDKARLARIKTMVSKNMLGTAMDYWRAAFLFQHGVVFDDYHMAHQLALCSMVLGKSDAKWIGAASYDRMLKSCGHHQRWGTQFFASDGKFSLGTTDIEGMCEFQRKTVVGLTLEESRNRKMDF